MKRFRLDLLLAVLFLLVMGFRVLTPLLHEVLGIVLLAGLALHLWWNRAWFAALGRGKWRRLRVVQAMLVVLLLASTLTALGTGLTAITTVATILAGLTTIATITTIAAL
jgi:hypothetical protein